MAVAPILMGSGAAIGAYGKIKANQDAAEAADMNASYYAEQADYANEIGLREEDLFKQKAKRTEAGMVAAYAKAGVDISGSPLLMKEALIISREKELNAIRQEKERRIRLARLKQQSEEFVANNYRDPFNQFLSVAPTVLGAAGGIYKGESGG